MTVEHRKIIVYIATSADGYIARPDGAVDWLHRPNLTDDYGHEEFMRSIDTILWGRKTWEVGLELGGDISAFGKDTRHYVFSRHPHRSENAAVEWVNEPIVEFAQPLRAAPGKHIWMMGGAELIGAFLDVGELDEFRIHVIPVFIGEGIPLIAPKHREIDLSLTACERYPDGVIQLHYQLDRSAIAAG